MYPKHDVCLSPSENTLEKGEIKCYAERGMEDFSKRISYKKENGK